MGSNLDRLQASFLTWPVCHSLLSQDPLTTTEMRCGLCVSKHYVLATVSELLSGGDLFCGSSGLRPVTAAGTGLHS